MTQNSDIIITVANNGFCLKVDRSQYPDPKFAGYYLLQDIRNPVSLLPEPEPDTGYPVEVSFVTKILLSKTPTVTGFFFPA